ncbi:Major allergen Pru ar like [Heracleum sosnowskyi]|uniref:Major allergen Pru ar like n=1 Tax=Heracleum sosnowskyi TaxID=360622 RepID=A0AAD8IKI3_9APIA|nr:Major allergen Pru ar like [Heracleum sosnowskyi]
MLISSISWNPMAMHTCKSHALQPKQFSKNRTPAIINLKHRHLFKSSVSNLHICLASSSIKSVEIKDEITKNVEGRSTVTAAEMYKAMFLDMDVVIPQILPQLIKSVQILEGDGGVGTIKYFTYGQAVKATSMKQKVITMDEEEMTYSYIVFEGDILSEKVESITNHFKVVPTDDGGCIVKLSVVFTPVAGEMVPEEYVKETIAQSFQVFMATEAYIQAD